MTGTFEGVGSLQFTPDNKYAYGFSGPVAVPHTGSASATLIEGKTGLELIDLVLSLTGISLWLIVSIIWRDRALIMLNSAGIFFLIRNLAERLMV